jgi:hypothetical protein
MHELLKFELIYYQYIIVNSCQKRSWKALEMVTPMDVKKDARLPSPRKAQKQPLPYREPGVSLVRFSKDGLKQESGSRMAAAVSSRLAHWKKSERLVRADYEGGLQNKLPVKLSRAHPRDPDTGFFLIAGAFREAKNANPAEKTMYKTHKLLCRCPVGHAVVIVRGQDAAGKEKKAIFTATVSCLTPPYDQSNDERAMKVVTNDHVIYPSKEDLGGIITVTTMEWFFSPVTDLKPSLADVEAEVKKSAEETVWPRWSPNLGNRTTLQRKQCAQKPPL